MSTEETKKTVLRFFDEIVNQQNFSGIREIFAPDVVEHEFKPGLFPPPAKQQRIGDIVSNVIDQIEAFTLAGEYSAVRVIGTGKPYAEFFGRPAPEKPLAWTATMIWRVEQGKIKERWMAFDYLSYMLHYGVIPPLKQIESQQPYTPHYTLDARPALDQAKQLEPLHRLIEAHRSGDISLLDGVVAPIYKDHGGWIDGLPDGPEGLKEEVRILRSAFPDLELEVTHLFASEKHVTLRMIGTGTHKGEIFGVPATNKQVSWMTIGIYAVENGRITERWIDGSRMELLRQLDAVPAVPFAPITSVGPDLLTLGDR
uniref:Ester cyclase n=1 Tax=Thermosporothrix sp. COM3 TaxID=2490863 RepID=A0A455SFQ2_9CHLR|nr:hypothetical protein KTC_13270 [Thermosporothrix sp. COM3]